MTTKRKPRPSIPSSPAPIYDTTSYDTSCDSSSVSCD